MQPSLRYSTTAKISVLSIGVDPLLVDLSGFPGLTPEKITTGVASEIGKLNDVGYEAKAIFIDLGQTAEQVVRGELTAKTYDCIVIGAGLRAPPAHFLLFERILNLVHAQAPQAKLCFNTLPTDTMQAVQRWV